MLTFLIIMIAFVSTSVLLRVLIRLAPSMKLVDHPGGRKDHLGTTPVVGGLSIGLVFIIALIYFQTSGWWVDVLAVLMLLTLGVFDDIHDLAPGPKFLVQAAAVLLMFYYGGLQLLTVGNLIGFGSMGTWFFAPAITVVAVIGVINAINMADGIDGHAGFISLIAFVAFAHVARESALWEQYKLLLALSGCVAAFLTLNARSPWLKHAKTFFGDAGSMLMGFIIAWFAVDLSQGEGRTFSPICALWVVVLPLCDCVSLMIRRRLSGGSMFAADRHHLHHFLLMRGASVGQATMASAAGNLVCAATGIIGWKLHVPEPIMFASFVALFISYHIYMTKLFHTTPDHRVTSEHTKLEMPLN
ncbi:MAG: MraY family glycosyltransferase [Betaproteobacteria bacterium]